MSERYFTSRRRRPGRDDRLDVNAVRSLRELGHRVVASAGDPLPVGAKILHRERRRDEPRPGPARYAELGRLVAKAGSTLTHDKLADYGRLLAQARTSRATRARHANVLQHLAGFFKRQLGGDERAERAELIADYRAGLIPLVVPLTLIRHHVRWFGVAYLADQTYLNPHPKE